MSFCTLPWLVWPVSKQPDVYTVPSFPLWDCFKLISHTLCKLVATTWEKKHFCQPQVFLVWCVISWFCYLLRRLSLEMLLRHRKRKLLGIALPRQSIYRDSVWSKADNIVSDVNHSLASSIYSSFCEFLFSSSIPWTLCYWFLIKSQIKTHIFVHFTHLLCTELNNGSVQNLPCVCSRVEIWLEHTNHIILIKPFCYHLFPMNVILEEITLISIKRIGFPLT